MDEPIRFRALGLVLLLQRSGERSARERGPGDRTDAEVLLVIFNPVSQSTRVVRYDMYGRLVDIDRSPSTSGTSRAPLPYTAGCSGFAWK
jgi:hypothetical protein